MSHAVRDLSAGKTLIVADLQGDHEAFTRYVGRFRQLHSRGRADRLLFLGDLIGSTPRGRSLADADRAILIAVDQLQVELGLDRVITLIGDRELALLNSGSIRDPALVRVLSAMPMLIRSASGIAFTHAGASRSALFGLADLLTGSDSSPGRSITAEMVGTACEQAESPALYARLVERFLHALSTAPGSPSPQRFLVSGHLPINGGYRVITPRQLRIASAAGAQPREAGIYLLLDLAESIHSLEGLTEHSGSVFTAPVNG